MKFEVFTVMCSHLTETELIYVWMDDNGVERCEWRVWLLVYLLVLIPRDDDVQFSSSSCVALLYMYFIPFIIVQSPMLRCIHTDQKRIIHKNDVAFYIEKWQTWSRIFSDFDLAQCERIFKAHSYWTKAGIFFTCLTSFNVKVNHWVSLNDIAFSVVFSVCVNVPLGVVLCGF